jgi:uncharacterized protein YdhG (YjbR/CyaY superfamily)
MDYPLSVFVRLILSMYQLTHVSQQVYGFYGIIKTMSVIDDYLATLSEEDQAVLLPMYRRIRELVPDVEEATYYAMPAFKYQGKGLVAVLANKQFYSLYPFGAVERLGLDLADFECTTGSVHFTADKPISDELLSAIIRVRLAQIKK